MGDNNQLLQCIIDREDIDFSWLKSIPDEDDRKEIERAIEFFYEHCNIDSEKRLTLDQAIRVLKYIVALTMEKKKKLYELEDIGALMSDYSGLDKTIGEVTAAYKRFRFIGFGAIEVSLKADDTLRVTIVKEADMQRIQDAYYPVGTNKNIALIYGGTTEDYKNIRLVLSNKEQCSGDNSYILTVATNSARKTLIEYDINEYVEWCQNEYGGIWFANSDSPYPEFYKTDWQRTKHNGVYYKVVQAKWYVHREYVGETLAIIDEVIDYKNKNASLFDKIKKLFSPGNDLSIILSAIISLFIPPEVGLVGAFFYGLGIGAAMLIGCASVPEWENCIIEKLEKLKKDIRTKSTEGKVRFKKDIVIEIGYTKDFSGNSEPFYNVKEWSDPGKMMGAEGCIGRGYDDDALPTWFKIGPPNSKDTIFNDFSSVVEMLENK